MFDSSSVRYQENNFEQVVFTLAHLSPNTTIWYQARAGDALPLGR